VRFEVTDTTHPSGDLILHVGKLTEGRINVGMTLEAAVDSGGRSAIRGHHTATHLLHESLCRVLGPHVRQAGSLVTPDFLRFDYNHFAPLEPKQINEVERMVYSEVLSDKPVTTTVMNYSDAKKKGVKALFEEKYGDVVRVLDIQGFSTELCGGTHVSSTGRIGLVKIVRDEGIGSGVRRITAVCGQGAMTAFQDAVALTRELCGVLEADADSVVTKIRSLIDEKKILERKNQEYVLASMMETARESLSKATKIDGVALVTQTFKGASRDMLRQIGDRIKQAERDSVILLAGFEGENVSLIGMASDEAVRGGAHAGNLVKEVSGLIGGSGGGKPAMGQGGGKDTARLDEALGLASDIVKRQLKNSPG
jgi:alanyl-tRNA synthetase